MTRRNGVARWIATGVSWIGHPLIFVTLTVSTLLLRQLPEGAALSLILALVLALIAPMAVLLVLGVRSGRWGDADVSVREERQRFFPIAIPLSVAGSVVMWFAGAPHYILRGAVITLLLLILAAVINRRFKISLHVLFAVYCAAVLLRFGTVAAVAGPALALCVFWSRLYLGRHTVAETVAGAAVGAAGGYVAAWWAG